MNTPTFKEFPKMGRLSRECIVTEKIDGTNASIHITQGSHKDDPYAITGWLGADGLNYKMLAGSRTKWITLIDDNFGFASWVYDNAQELLKLGVGTHFGEWWGQGIQRKYGLSERRLSLFNVTRWCLHGQEPQIIPSQNPQVLKYQDVLPPCVGLVPVLYKGIFDTARIEATLTYLGATGSQAAPGFMNPEGIVVFHTAANVGFKKTLDKDELPKSKH
jgi:hypothetical protein